MAESAMQELMVDQLRDLYDAEKQLTKALPKLAKATRDEELKQGFKDHLSQTQGHVQRIEQIFEAMGMKAKSKPCEAMKGLVKEGQEAIEEDLDAPVGDIALIAAARRVEHYEMAAYGTLVMAAQAMKNTQVVSLLQETLKEEEATDKRLAGVAKRLLKEALKPQAEVEVKPAAKKSAGPAAKKATGPATKKAVAKTAGSKALGGSAPKASAKSGKKSSGGKSASHSNGAGDHTSHTTMDHDEIRSWAEERGGKPSCVRGTGKKGDIGLMRIEFPGAPNANDDQLEEISWEDFFEKFDERGLALVYQAETAEGQKSNFNKIITAETAKPKK